MERSANRLRDRLTLADDHMKALSGLVPNLGPILNDKFRLIEEQLEKRSGLRGPVEVNDHIDMQLNALKEVADPTAADHLVNFGTLQRFSTCQYFEQQLDRSSEFEDFIDEEAEIGGVFDTPWAFGYHYVHPHTLTSQSPIASANDIIAFGFTLGFTLTVDTISYELTGASAAGTLLAIGLYDDAKNLLLTSGPQPADATPDQYTVSLSSSVSLVPGFYYLAYTATALPTVRCFASAAEMTAMLNEHRNAQGTNATDSVGAVLPATLGTLTSNGRDCPLVFFENA